MITCGRLGNLGRLGNQLWQIASTAGIAQQVGQSAGFHHWDYRPFFNLPNEFFPDDYFSRELHQAKDSPLVEHMAPLSREYLQDYHLWETIAPEVWKWFQPSNLAKVTHRNYDEFFALPMPILAVHVRLGDNLKNPNNCHPCRPMSYYHDALDMLEGEVESVVIFSDDIQWCREAFKGRWIDLFYEGGKARKKEHERGYKTDPFSDWIDLQAMSMCERHIISNSTYAWWGAYLSHDLAPIYPTPFFGAELDWVDTSLMFPPTWVPIDHGQIHV